MLVTTRSCPTFANRFAMLRSPPRPWVAAGVFQAEGREGLRVISLALALVGSLALLLAVAAPAAALEQKLVGADGAASDKLGISVAVAGETVVAGADGDDVGANANQGLCLGLLRAGTDLAGGFRPGVGSGSVLRPGACANRKRGTSAANRLQGTSAGDRLFGLRGADRLFGLAGADCLSGGPGADRLLGGPGNDKLSGGSGRNRYAAGAGKDSIGARNNKREQVDCGPGRDSANVDRYDRVRRCERIRRR